MNIDEIFPAPQPSSSSSSETVSLDQHQQLEAGDEMGGEVDSGGAGGDADAEFSSFPVPGAPSSSVVMAHERCHPANVTSGSAGMSDDVGMVVYERSCTESNAADRWCYH